jgi:hypothetical protein
MMGDGRAGEQRRLLFIAHITQVADLGVRGNIQYLVTGQHQIGRIGPR